MYEPLGLWAWCSQEAGSHDSFVRDHNSDYHVSPNFRVSTRCSQEQMVLRAAWDVPDLITISRNTC